jgi:hypothetical protein
LGTEIEFGGARVTGYEALFFALLERVKTTAFDHGHERFKKDSRDIRNRQAARNARKKIYTEGAEFTEDTEKRGRITGDRG